MQETVKLIKEYNAEYLRYDNDNKVKIKLICESKEYKNWIEFI